MPSGVQIAPSVWDAAKKAVERGEKYTEVAMRLGIKRGTLKAKSEKHKWQTPARRANAAAKADPVTRVLESQNGELGAFRAEISDLTEPDRVRLVEALREGPDAFRQALQSAARSTLAASFGQIPMPRTIAEFKAVVDILDKAEKMGGTAGTDGFIRSPAGIAPRVIEAEVIPPVQVDGFTI